MNHEITANLPAHGGIATAYNPANHAWQSVRWCAELPRLGWHIIGYYGSNAEAIAAAEAATFDGVKWVLA